MVGPSVFRELHTSRRPVQQSNADLLFELANGGGGAPLLYAKAIGRASEAPHLGNPDEDEDWLKAMHFNTSQLDQLGRTICSL